MKKVMFIIVGLLVSVSVNAATLSWNSVDTTWQTFESASLITATKNFNESNNQAYTRTLSFNVADGPATLDGLLVETTDAQFDIASVSLAGNSLVFNALTSRWNLNNLVVLATGTYDFVIDINNVIKGGLLNVQISQVPVPAALLLFAPALLGFFGLRRKAAVAA